MKAYIFKFLFEKLIPFSWINGNKTEISKYATFISSILLLATEFFPEYVPYLTQTQAIIATVLSLVGIQIGQEHKEIKAQG